MKTLVITALSATLTLTACGKPIGASNKGVAVASSTSATLSPAGIPSAPQLSAQQAGAVTKVISQLTSDLFNSLSGLPAGNFTSGAQSASVTLSCPMGGTAALSGAGQLSISGSLTSPTGALTGGSGSVLLTNCQIQLAGAVMKLNGALSLTSVSGTGGATVTLSQAQFTTQGSARSAGLLNVEVAGRSVSCAVATSSTINAAGVFVFSDYTTGGTVTASTGGTVCNLPVSEIVSFGL